jgi:hypothetical protein
MTRHEPRCAFRLSIAIALAACAQRAAGTEIGLAILSARCAFRQSLAGLSELEVPGIARLGPASAGLSNRLRRTVAGYRLADVTFSTSSCTSSPESSNARHAERLSFPLDVLGTSRARTRKTQVGVSPKV